MEKHELFANGLMLILPDGVAVNNDVYGGTYPAAARLGSYEDMFDSGSNTNFKDFLHTPRGKPYLEAVIALHREVYGG